MGSNASAVRKLSKKLNFWMITRTSTEIVEAVRDLSAPMRSAEPHIRRLPKHIGTMPQKGCAIHVVNCVSAGDVTLKKRQLSSIATLLGIFTECAEANKSVSLSRNWNELFGWPCHAELSSVSYSKMSMAAHFGALIKCAQHANFRNKKKGEPTQRKVGHSGKGKELFGWPCHAELSSVS